MNLSGTSGRRTLQCLALCAAAAFGATPGFAQATGASVGVAREGELQLGEPQSLDNGTETQERGGPELPGNTGCSVRCFTRDAWTEVRQLGDGLKAAPRGLVRPHNLQWELPILAATGILIAKADSPAANRIQSESLQQTAGRWSNVGLGLELGSGALAYGIGCRTQNSYLRETGFKALAAMGAAGAVDLGLKLAFDREYPTTGDSRGRFWAGGRSFPSGHSATSFAFAAVVAHRYPNNKWVKWGAYALAAGVSLSRYPAKKHFPSDVLIGATLGYVIGTYMGQR
ncbi:MAG: hypothetical protein NVS9B5_35010 [Terriglobales bacterium]